MQQRHETRSYVQKWATTIREECGPATEYPIRFVLTVFRTFTTVSTEVKDISNELRVKETTGEKPN